jgi:peptidase E
MSGQEYIKAFKRFAGNLLQQYSVDVLLIPDANREQKLHVLEKAMYKMENELNGKVADIIAVTETNPAINEYQLEKGLREVFSSSLKELVRRNYRG